METELNENEILAPKPEYKIKVPEVTPLPKGLIIFGFISTWAALALGIIAAVLITITVIEENNNKSSMLAQVTTELNNVENGDEDANSSVATSGAKKPEMPAFAVGGMIFGMLAVMGFGCAALLSVIIYLMVFYRGWKVLQSLRLISPGDALDMPASGVATGLLFLPYFNFAWLFPAYMGFEKYGAKLAALRGLTYDGPTAKLAKWQGILFILMVVLFPLFPIIWIILMIISFLLTMRINTMIETLGKPFMIDRS